MDHSLARWLLATGLFLNLVTGSAQADDNSSAEEPSAEANGLMDATEPSAEANELLDAAGSSAEANKLIDATGPSAEANKLIDATDPSAEANGLIDATGPSEDLLHDNQEETLLDEETTPEAASPLETYMRALLEGEHSPEVLELLQKVNSAMQEQGVDDHEFIGPLLQLLDFKEDADSRRKAAETLGGLNDPRAVIPLIYATQDPKVVVQVAVIEALGHYRMERVEEKLEVLAADNARASVAREAAVSSLGAQASETARDFLFAVHQDEKYPRGVREKSAEALETYFPGFLSSKGESGVVLDRRGRWLLVPASVGFGAYAMGAVGRFGASEASIPIGITSGALLGGASAFLLTQKQEMTYANAASITTAGGWGLWTGLTAGRLMTWNRCTEVSEEDDNAFNDYRDCLSRSDDIIYSAGLVGEAGGLAAAAFNLRKIPYSFKDVVTINLGGMASHNLIWGLEYLASSQQAGNSRRWAAATLAGSLAGLTATSEITDRLHFSRGDVATVTGGTLLGGWYGTWLPYAINDSSSNDDAIGGLLLGSSLGMVGSAFLSQHTSLSVGDNYFIGAGSAYGSLFGFGAPLVVGAALGLEEELQSPVRGMLLGSLVGGGATAFLRDRFEYESGDIALTGMTTALGLYHGLAIGAYWDEVATDDVFERTIGSPFVGSGLGGFSGMLISQRMSFTPWKVLMLSSGAMWGAWFAGWGNALANSNLETSLLSTLIATDLGLAGAGVLLSPVVGVHPTRVGWANLAGMSGSAIFSMGAALASGDEDVIIGANLAGSAIGLTAGAIAARYIDVDKVHVRAGKAGRVLARARAWHPALALTPYVSSTGPDEQAQNDGWMLTVSAVQPVN